MPDEGSRFTDVQDGVLRDTFETLGIDPSDEAAFTPNVRFLERLSSWFDTPPDSRGDMPSPSVQGVFGPGMEPSMMATFDVFGEGYGDNQEATEWLKEQRQVLAQEYQEPMHKNRVVGLMDQSVMGGRQRAMAARDAQAGPQAPPPVAPTPTPGLSIEGEIAAEEERRRKLQGNQ